ncbi:MAG: 2-isopropylmalate synthase [Deltaproteobacteria bacterium]|nr:2-isopropylmalate synthase [Deltaproteobacteria bacterium]
MNKETGIVVFDTTLRDGEQMPGLAFSAEDKVTIARKLDELGVQVIEAGFPANSPEELAAVRQVCGQVGAQVCAMARVKRQDIEAVISSGAGMVDVFCSTSDIQMKSSRQTTPDQVLAASQEAVAQVKEAGLECVFTPMDASRTGPGFLVEVCQAARQAGADWINLTDTVGVGTPAFITEMVARVAAAVDGPLSIHCHDDFGLATANTLAAVQAGASMVQVCLNGLGERAGNASLEEVVMALGCLLDKDCGLAIDRLYEASRLLERLSGVTVPPNKPVVGANAFCHESGIHAAGITRDLRTFEPGLMTPEMVGHRRRLVAGKHAGRHGIAQALKEAGLEPNEAELTEIVHRVRSLGAKGRMILSADLFAMAEAVMQKVPAESRAIVLEQLIVTTGDKIEPTATVKARVHGQARIEAQAGVGPVDAAFKAVQRMLGGDPWVEISEYHVDAVTGGSGATVRVSVSVEDEAGRTASAQAAAVDIVMASVEALLTAINHLIRLRESLAKQIEAVA